MPRNEHDLAACFLPVAEFVAWSKSHMSITKIVLLVVVLAAAVGIGVVAVFATDLEREKVEKPRYEVIAEKNAYEIRRYEPYIVAQVVISGNEGDAMGRGFRPLADYIFGNNTKKSEIAMTSPVIAKEAQNEKIAMTSPVVQEENDSGETMVAFIMPSEYTMETLPEPNNDNVKLAAVPAQTFAAIRFSGMGGQDAMNEHEAMLRKALESDEVEITGKPIYARYDPPWTLPNLRRNEVMIPVAWSAEDRPSSPNP
jgi:hypothetical protein